MSTPLLLLLTPHLNPAPRLATHGVASYGSLS